MEECVSPEYSLYMYTVRMSILCVCLGTAYLGHVTSSTELHQFKNVCPLQQKEFKVPNLHTIHTYHEATSGKLWI